MDTNSTGERDYPVGHPAASDYAGEPYTPPPPPLGRDYPVGHPKAADSPQNIAEGIAQMKERSAPGQPGVPTDSDVQPAGGSTAPQSSSGLNIRPLSQKAS